MATVTELVTKFSFQGNLSKLDHFNGGLGKGIVQVGKFGLALKGIQAAINAFTISTMSSLAPLVDLSTKTGIAIDRIQALEYATIKAGGSGDALKGSLNSLSQKIAEAGLKGSEDFARIGVSVRNVSGQLKTADSVLLEVGQKLKGISSQSQRANLASKLGIDANTLALITKSKGEIKGLINCGYKFGLVTQEQSEKITQFNASINVLKFGLSAIQNQVAIGLSPELKELADWFSEVIKNNKDWIANGIKVLVKWIGELSKMISRIVTFIWDFAKAIMGSNEGVMMLIASLLLLASPITATVALITGILLVIDDLIVAFNGGKSVIRDFFLEFFGFDITPVIHGMVDAFKQFFEEVRQIFSDLVDAISSIFSGVIKIIKGDFGDGFKDIVSGIETAFLAIPKSLMRIFEPVFKWISDKIKSVVPDWLLDWMGVDTTASTASVINSDSSLSPNDGYGSNSSQNNTQNVNNQNVFNITSNDTKATGERVKDVLNEQYADTNNQFSVMRGY